jgi:hypothetical protein
MKEYVSFSYKSVGNIVKLFATIFVEKEEDPVEVAIWHERFDNDESDELFECFVAELWPDGKVINPEDVSAIVYKAKKFLETDKTAQDIRNRYLKFKNPFWVYFKPLNRVYPCHYAEHHKTITNICKDFFKGFEDIDYMELAEFIKKNFEISSDNSTVSGIAKDAQFIAREIVLN